MKPRSGRLEREIKEERFLETLHPESCRALTFPYTSWCLPLFGVRPFQWIPPGY